MWKPIAGYEGLYCINKSGQVRSAKRNTSPGKILKHLYDSSGYAQVSLCKNGQPAAYRVHILVAQTFMGACPEGLEVNHKDGNKANPRLKNLEYGTHQWNMLHSRRVLKNKGGIFRGEAAWNHKLTNKDVLLIRDMDVHGVKQCVIAIKFGVCRDTIRKVTQRIYWRHI
jgi:hypothetical protein